MQKWVNFCNACSLDRYLMRYNYNVPWFNWYHSYKTLIKLARAKKTFLCTGASEPFLKDIEKRTTLLRKKIEFNTLNKLSKLSKFAGLYTNQNLVLPSLSIKNFADPD